MKPLLILIATSLILACTRKNEDVRTNGRGTETGRAKFEPDDGEVILFAGQELEAIGGLDRYNDGYLDHFEAPGGFTMYTNFSPGDSTFGAVKGNDGVLTTDDWGDGDSNMSLQIADPDFENMALAIGLAFVGHEEAVARGERDSLMIGLGKWIKSLGRRPVFLRIGYEFHGPWNNYDRENYLKAYRRIKDTYDSLGVDNIAYVWQSHGFDESLELLESWYPGDDYVDWCAYSFFNRYKETSMMEFARQKKKPVFIAEATPAISGPTVQTDGNALETILSNPDQAQQAWEKWFVPFFTTIEENPDLIKAVHYINAHWKSRPMWKTNPVFDQVDARLQTNPDLKQKWIKKTSDPRYLKASPQLFDALWKDERPATGQ